MKNEKKEQIIITHNQMFTKKQILDIFDAKIPKFGQNIVKFHEF